MNQNIVRKCQKHCTGKALPIMMIEEKHTVVPKMLIATAEE